MFHVLSLLIFINHEGRKDKCFLLTGVETEVGTCGMQQVQIQHFYFQTYDSVLSLLYHAF